MNRAESEMTRYIRRLSDRDLALDRSMIPLGSCTMKLNATAEMLPISWPEFADIHPFAPADQTTGYLTLIHRLQGWLCAATGFAGIPIGLALTLIHLVSIPVTNTSVNPARSTGPALFAGAEYVGQLWLFWVAPILGAMVAGAVTRMLYEPADPVDTVVVDQRKAA